MLDTTEISLFEKVEKLEAEFSSAQEAFEYFSNQLEKLAGQFGLSIEEAISKAEKSSTFDKNLMEIHSLSNKVLAMKRIINAEEA